MQAEGLGKLSDFPKALYSIND